MNYKMHGVFVGAETGLLKRVDYGKKTWSNVNSIEKAEKDFEVVSLCWNDAEQTEICRGLRNQNIVVQSTNETRCINLAGGEGALKGLAKIDRDYLTCTELGSMRLWSDDAVQKMEKTVGSNVCCMKVSAAERNLVATGGKENELKVWDLQKLDSAVFAAKNPQHDWLNLRKPVWILDAEFVPHSKHIVSATSYQQVRLYDAAAQRRPVIEMLFGDSPITSVSCRSSGQQMVVGNSHGGMALLDLRGKGHIVHQYKGSLGGLRQVLCHPTTDIVASCGLDRFLRIYEIDSKQLLYKSYLKSRLNCLLFQDKGSCFAPHGAESDLAQVSSTNTLPEAASPSDDVEDEGGDEALWSNMEVVHATKLKRKSKAESGREIRQAQLEEASLASNTFKHSLPKEKKDARKKKKIRHD